MVIMAFEKELDTFRRALPQLLNDEGKFAVISGDLVIGVFDSYQDALAKGYERCGLGTFLVKEIHAFEHAHFITGSLNFSCLG
jgi:hypothetical protein